MCFLQPLLHYLCFLNCCVNNCCGRNVEDERSHCDPFCRHLPRRREKDTQLLMESYEPLTPPHGPNTHPATPNSDYPAAQPLPETIRIRKDSAGATAQQSSGFVVDKTRNAVRIAADSQASQAGTEGKLSHQDPPNKSLTMEQQPKSRISSIPRQDWSIEDDNPTWHVPIPDGESYLEAATQCGDRPVGSIVSECSSDPVDSDGVHSWHSFPANHVLGSSHSLASTKISIEAAIENTEFIIKSLAPECETDRDDSHASDSWVWSKKDNSFPKRPKSHSYTKSPLSAAIERMEEEYLRNFPSGSSSKTSSSIDHKAPPPLLTPKKRTSSGSFTSTTRRRKNNSSTDLAKEGAGPLLKEASFPKAVPKVIVNWLSVKGISTWHASYKSAYVQKLAMGEEPVCASSIPGSYITGIDGVQKGRKSKYSENLQNRRAYKRKQILHDLSLIYRTPGPTDRRHMGNRSW